MGRPVSGLASLDMSPSQTEVQWRDDMPALADRCGGSSGFAFCETRTAFPFNRARRILARHLTHSPSAKTTLPDSGRIVPEAHLAQKLVALIAVTVLSFHCDNLIVMSAHPVRLNLLLAALLAALQLLGWVFWPLWLKDLAGPLLLLLPILATLPHWALLHEGIHAALVDDRAWNRRLSRGLAILIGTPFSFVRQGHLLHHRDNRVHDLSETFDPAACPRWQANLRHYFTILGGLHLIEALGSLWVWLPRRWRERTHAIAGDNPMSRDFAHAFEKPETLAEARTDGFFIVALWGLALTLYGDAAGWLLAVFAGRALLLSFFDNAYHYGTAAGNPRHGRNLALPNWLSTLILHFNYHGVHHLYPNKAWTQLPTLAKRMEIAFDGDLLTTALAQLRGPLPRCALESVP